jgi:hypothetical protein
MSLSHEIPHADEQFVRYLLGLLTEEEAERVDELSIADDDIAWRLRAAENDLVDAYVRGTLKDTDRARFERVYLVTPKRRDKVRVDRARGGATGTSRLHVGASAGEGALLAAASPGAASHRLGAGGRGDAVPGAVGHAADADVTAA